MYIYIYIYREREILCRYIHIHNTLVHVQYSHKYAYICESDLHLQHLWPMCRLFAALQSHTPRHWTLSRAVYFLQRAPPHVVYHSLYALDSVRAGRLPPGGTRYFGPGDRNDRNCKYETSSKPFFFNPRLKFCLLVFGLAFEHLLNFVQPGKPEKLFRAS